tara:strand:- start:3851 stop:4894 length:1044 start_codon:yes stop_codon:yes gene_type:complete
MKVFEEPTFGEKMKLEEEFYDDEFYLSYSGLNKLLFSPDAFYRHYVLGQKDDTSTQAMIEGSLLHCLLLQPKFFDDYYVLNHEDTPSPAQVGLIKHLYGYYEQDVKNEAYVREDLSEYSEEILDHLQDIALYQSLKNDTGRLAKVLTPKSEAYFEYLKIADGKTVIDHDVYNHIQEAVEKIKSNPSVMECLGFFADSMNGIETKNELMLAYPDTGYLFGIRGMIDNLVFDPQRKEIRINDLKSSGKNLASFSESIEYYKYWIQAAIYTKLVTKVYLNKPEYNGWKTTYRFVVVDKYCTTGIIKISDDTLLQWMEETHKLLDQANYHFEKRDFKLPYEFLINGNELVI